MTQPPQPNSPTLHDARSKDTTKKHKEDKHDRKRKTKSKESEDCRTTRRTLRWRQDETRRLLHGCEDGRSKRSPLRTETRGARPRFLDDTDRALRWGRRSLTSWSPAGRVAASNTSGPFRDTTRKHASRPTPPGPTKHPDAPKRSVQLPKPRHKIGPGERGTCEAAQGGKRQRHELREPVQDQRTAPRASGKTNNADDSGQKPQLGTEVT